MSHEATNWAFGQRGVGTAKLVLLVLADCHNPVYGCFPSQAYLADKCEISRDTVNEHLRLLEGRGLIRRERSIDPVTKRRRSTRYKLAFEADFEASGDDTAATNEGEKAMSEIPTRTPEAMSDIPAKPCRIYPESHVGNSDTNLVRESLREPTRAGAPAGETQTEPDRLLAFERFWQAHPKPRKRERSLALWLAAEKSGVDPQRINSEAGRYRQGSMGKDAQYLVSSDRWLEQRRWEGEPGKPAVSQDERVRGIEAAADHLAGRLRAGAYVAPSAWSPAIVACVLGRSLLTLDQLRAAGVRV
ncbi:helix-turn-helix domain-containing protein [Paracoccus sp. (in: a-proteobacteria)]|uniref:helix-turn-helix domain-containing protein n=1 Tax=Paracoccus sp. TaxID=267 RepID=UPI0028AC3DA5|nr:helix-turn-helix domain-containing protein [Paracoccus sp. (in: a-proteobacteria)]